MTITKEIQNYNDGKLNYPPTYTKLLVNSYNLFDFNKIILYKPAYLGSLKLIYLNILIQIVHFSPNRLTIICIWFINNVPAIKTAYYHNIYIHSVSFGSFIIVACI